MLSLLKCFYKTYDVIRNFRLGLLFIRSGVAVAPPCPPRSYATAFYSILFYVELNVKSIFFCKFTLLVNIKDLHNIR